MIKRHHCQLTSPYNLSLFLDLLMVYKKKERRDSMFQMWALLLLLLLLLWLQLPPPTCLTGRWVEVKVEVEGGLWGSAGEIWQVPLKRKSRRRDGSVLRTQQRSWRRIIMRMEFFSRMKAAGVITLTMMMISLHQIYSSSAQVGTGVWPGHAFLKNKKNVKSSIFGPKVS